MGGSHRLGRPPFAPHPAGVLTLCPPPSPPALELLKAAIAVP